MSDQAEKLLRWGLRVPGRLNFNGYLDFERPVCLLPDCGIVNSSIGSFSYAARRTSITAADIGRFCSIGEDCHIGLGQHPTNHLTSSSVLYDANFWSWSGPGRSMIQHADIYRRTSIGNDVWIGTRAMVCGGVKIGDGAIIAAGAVVTKDVAPYTVVGGVPARVIKYRFSKDVIDRLMGIMWFRYDIYAWSNSSAYPIGCQFDHNLLNKIEDAISSGELSFVKSAWSRLKSENGSITIGHKSSDMD